MSMDAAVPSRAPLRLKFYEKLRPLADPPSPRCRYSQGVRQSIYRKENGNNGTEHDTRYRTSSSRLEKVVPTLSAWERRG